MVNQGDILIQKAPSATIETLAKALIEIFNSKSKLKTLALDMVKKCMKLLLQKRK